MRDFFVRWLERLVDVIVVLAAIGIIAAAVISMSHPAGGLHSLIMVLVGGFINLTLIAGFIYLQIGIYHNTRRTAEAVEAQLHRR